MLTVTTTADLAALATLRSFITQACHHYAISEEICCQLQLAVDELCTNIINYGYANHAVQESARLTVSFAYLAGQIKITIVDHGAPFDPQQVGPPDLTSDWETRAVGGLGIYLAQQVVDRMDYTADPVAGNCITLMKTWKGAPHDDAD